MNLIINVWHAEKKTQIVALTFFGSELLVYVPFQHIIVMPNLSATRECGSFQLGFFTYLRVIDYFFSTCYANYILKNSNLYFQDFVDKSETRFHVAVGELNLLLFAL